MSISEGSQTSPPRERRTPSDGGRVPPCRSIVLRLVYEIQKFDIEQCILMNVLYTWLSIRMLFFLLSNVYHKNISLLYLLCSLSYSSIGSTHSSLIHIKLSYFSILVLLGDSYIGLQYVGCDPIPGIPTNRSLSIATGGRTRPQDPLVVILYDALQNYAASAVSWNTIIKTCELYYV